MGGEGAPAVGKDFHSHPELFLSLKPSAYPPKSAHVKPKRGRVLDLGAGLARGWRGAQLVRANRGQGGGARTRGAPGEFGAQTDGAGGVLRSST